jgi:hypothetical protein
VGRGERERERGTFFACGSSESGVLVVTLRFGRGIDTRKSHQKNGERVKGRKGKKEGKRSEGKRSEAKRSEGGGEGEEWEGRKERKKERKEGRKEERKKGRKKEGRKEGKPFLSTGREDDVNSATHPNSLPPLPSLPPSLLL